MIQRPRQNLSHEDGDNNDYDDNNIVQNNHIQVSLDENYQRGDHQNENDKMNLGRSGSSNSNDGGGDGANRNNFNDLVAKKSGLDDDPQNNSARVSYQKRRPSLILNPNNHIVKKSLIESIEESFRTKAKKAIMEPIPKKQLMLSLFLMLVGFIFIIIGLIINFRDNDSDRSIAFWVIGGVCSIPGFYYSFKFYKALRASTPEERKIALSDVPLEQRF